MTKRSFYTIQYVLKRDINLSQIVEIYFQFLTIENKIVVFDISPLVKSISTGKSISTDADYKKEYFDYLM